MLVLKDDSEIPNDCVNGYQLCEILESIVKVVVALSIVILFKQALCFLGLLNFKKITC